MLLGPKDNKNGKGDKRSQAEKDADDKEYKEALNALSKALNATETKTIDI